MFLMDFKSLIKLQFNLPVIFCLFFCSSCFDNLFTQQKLKKAGKGKVVLQNNDDETDEEKSDDKQPCNDEVDHNKPNNHKTADDINGDTYKKKLKKNPSKNPKQKPWSLLELVHKPNLDLGLQDKIAKVIEEIKSPYTPTHSPLNGIGKVKMKIIAKVFKLITEQDAKKLFSQMLFERFYICNKHFDSKNSYFRTQNIDTKKATKFINSIKIEKNKGFEYKPTKDSDCTIYINPNFANKYVGGGRSDKAIVQEEVQALEFMYIIFKKTISTYKYLKTKGCSLMRNEVALFSNIPRFLNINFNKISSKKHKKRTGKILNNIKEFKINANEITKNRFNILCIDTINASSNKNKYTKDSDLYQKEVFWFSYKKLIVGLLSVIHKYGNEFTEKGKKQLNIEFIWGNWGSGAFGNSSYLMYAAFFCAIAFVNDKLSEIEQNTLNNNLKININPILYPLEFDHVVNTTKTIFTEAIKKSGQINMEQVFENMKNYVNKNHKGKFNYGASNTGT